MEKIAWIGLGNMGLPMARNIAKAHPNVVVYNRTVKPLDLGECQFAHSLQEAVEGAQLVFLMVSDGIVVRELLFGEQGIARQLANGSLIVNMSTIGVDETKEFALELANYAIEFMDAPVSGSVQPATSGELVILVGGSDAGFARVEPYFLAMGRRAYHLGPVGSGASMKLLVNAFLGVTLEVAAECMAVAEKSGLGKEQWLEVLSSTGVWSPLLAGKRSLWVNDDYPAAFALKHMVKDLGLTVDFSKQLSVGLPTVFAALGMFLSAQANGHGEQDMAAIARHVAGLAGLV